MRSLLTFASDMRDGNPIGKTTIGHLLETDTGENGRDFVRQMEQADRFRQTLRSAHPTVRLAIGCDDSEPNYRRLEILLEYLSKRIASCVTALEDPRTSRGRRKNLALPVLLSRLMDCYEEHSGRAPGISWDNYNEVPSGPFFRFVSACFSELNIKVEASTLFQKIKDVRKGRAETRKS